MTIVDGTQMYEDAIRRIQELEKLNSLLAEQIDRQRVVIEAIREISSQPPTPPYQRRHGKNVGSASDRVGG